jgi:hypothetical protein
VKKATRVQAHAVYIWERATNPQRDSLMALIAKVPISTYLNEPTHRSSDGGLVIAEETNNLLVFLHKLGLRGRG